MNLLQERLRQLRQQGKKGLAVFITAGYPSLAATKEIVPVLAESGADIIELGVPFSDPIADGPVIQHSSEIAVRNHVSLGKVLSLAGELKKKVRVPLVLMSYLNPLQNGGVEKNVRRAGENGVDGFIVPDVIPEEAGEVRAACARNGLDLILMAAPNTPPERMACIDRESTAFVYVVSIAGVTGQRKTFSGNIVPYLKKTRLHIKGHPRFMGFGISGPEQVRLYRDYVDGVIVGSAIIEIIRAGGSAAQRNARLSSFIRSLRRALDHA
jgi:tryptophan synthase alpha chain